MLYAKVTQLQRVYARDFKRMQEGDSKVSPMEKTINSVYTFAVDVGVYTTPFSLENAAV